MKSWKRRILLVIALGSFFTIAPALVFYAMGYRYDFENKSFRKIGMIIIESEPKNADILIDDQQKSKTPFRIKNLLPGEYSVKVSKENFNVWEKKLSVESKKVTWASNIKLFFNNPKVNPLSDIQFENFSVSPDYEKIIAFSREEKNHGLFLINLKTKELEKIFDAKNKDLLSSITNNQDVNFSNFKWSSDGEKLILSLDNENHDESNYIIIELLKENHIIPLNNFYDLNIRKIEWKNSNDIYLLDQGKNLHQISLDSKPEPKTILNSILDFDYDNNQEELAYLKENKDKFELWAILANQEKFIMNLDNKEEYKIEEGKNNNIAILFKNRKKLYLVNTRTKKPLIIGENIEDFNWSREKNKLVYYNKNEIWFYAPLEEEKENMNKLVYKYNEANLLTRYSAEIDNVLWYPNEEYLVIIIDDSIKIIELDGRDKRNCYEIKNNFGIKNYGIEFDKNGNKIYFITSNLNSILEIEITED